MPSVFASLPGLGTLANGVMFIDISKDQTPGITDGMRVGLGTGSTVHFTIVALGERRPDIICAATSERTRALATELGLRVVPPDELLELDVAIDGADEVDARFNLIKGGGGALLKEKIVAASSRKNIIIADEKKKVNTLGEGNHPVPLEILPFAIALVQHRIQALGGSPLLRETKGKLGPIFSDNGNAIMDATFGNIKNPKLLDQQLKMVPGIVETGLFIDLTDIVYLGSASGTQKLETKRK